MTQGLFSFRRAILTTPFKFKPNEKSSIVFGLPDGRPARFPISPCVGGRKL